MVERQNKETVRVEAGGSGNQPKVEILLATYNGERFLREQIDSILNQDYGNLHVLARDDGSSDETVNILNEYANRHPDRFRVMPPTPATGSAKENFLLLMQESSAQYVCFADQDDVWLLNKVSRTKQAMDQLESKWGTDIPFLVFTDLQVVDDQLRNLHESFWTHEKIEPDRTNHLALLLGQSVVTGCTVMLNRRLLELSLQMPDEASMHDRWIGLVASAMGKTSAIRTQTVLYRQHDRNVVGVQEKSKSLQGVVRRLVKRDAREAQWKISQRQAEAFLKIYTGKLSAKHYALISAYLRCGSSRSRLLRIAIFIRYGICRLSSLRDLAMMLDI
jgi:glycosyltransferase involved in cell wall biosynthesis